MFSICIFLCSLLDFIHEFQHGLILFFLSLFLLLHQLLSIITIIRVKIIYIEIILIPKNVALSTHLNSSHLIIPLKLIYLCPNCQYWAPLQHLKCICLDLRVWNRLFWSLLIIKHFLLKMNVIDHLNQRRSPHHFHSPLLLSSQGSPSTLRFHQALITESPWLACQCFLFQLGWWHG